MRDIIYSSTFNKTLKKTIWVAKLAYYKREVYKNKKVDIWSAPLSLDRYHTIYWSVWFVIVLFYNSCEDQFLLIRLKLHVIFCRYGKIVQMNFSHYILVLSKQLMNLNLASAGSKYWCSDRRAQEGFYLLRLSDAYMRQ